MRLMREDRAALSAGFAAVGIKADIGARSGSFCDGDFNLLHAGRKRVGTAQRWAIGADGSAICLHHCVVLTGGYPDTLCRRAEALYDHAGCQWTTYGTRTARL